MALDKITTDIIADDAITAPKIVAGAVTADIAEGGVTGTQIGYFENATSTQNLSGTYSTERMYLNDSYTLTGNVTVTGHLALGTIADEDIVITQDSTERTITGSGTLEAGNVLQDTQKSDLTGMIAPFAMAFVPTGWLPCDGSSILRAGTYANLFSAIGTTWGSADGTHFNVPDLRGAFLRGTGSHGSQNMADGNDFAGPSVGAFENDQSQDHWFGDNTAKNPNAGTYAGGSGGNAALRLKDGGKRNYATSHNADNNHGGVDLQYEVDGAGALDPLIPISNKTHGTPRVGSENRPFNVGIQYCIKY